MIIYIHQNPQNHSIAHQFSKYNFSSYQSILSKSRTLLKRDEVIELFGGVENFKLSHLRTINLKEEF
jgi:hypothetical protein